jgi:hypothetical protein
VRKNLLKRTTPASNSAAKQNAIAMVNGTWMMPNTSTRSTPPQNADELNTVA